MKLIICARKEEQRKIRLLRHHPLPSSTGNLSPDRSIVAAAPSVMSGYSIYAPAVRCPRATRPTSCKDAGRRGCQRRPESTARLETTEHHRRSPAPRSRVAPDKPVAPPLPLPPRPGSWRHLVASCTDNPTPSRDPVQYGGTASNGREGVGGTTSNGREGGGRKSFCGNCPAPPPATKMRGGGVSRFHPDPTCLRMFSGP
jgi:hypothetical protein